MTAKLSWTDDQRRAIETVDRSVLVSAAAGSGKTAVLAARCAHLVCTAPPEQRCDIDRLLVVTFTEAAAAEMRERIREALAAQSMAAPQDRRLRAQTALVDTAQISTLHAFCLWMVRRWFHRIEVDATAQLLDEDEARLLRQETLDALFNKLYNAESEAAERFRTLVDTYGLGDDRPIAAFVLRLAAFLQSRPDPDAWLARARDDRPARAEEVIRATRDALALEVDRQAQHCRASAEYVASHCPAGAFYGDLLHTYASALENWHVRLDAGEDWDGVRQEIEGYELSSRGAPRVGKDATEATIEQRDRARALFNEARDQLLKRRLQNALCRFAPAELIDGMTQTMPHVGTLAELAQAFIERYAQAKRAIGVMDFADLERFAYALLTTQGDAEDTNPVVEELRTRFAYVLVDEFQDINPLQAELLALISRESDPARRGNFFAVGDVKQSIYRFRLAEPAMFLERRRLANDPATDACGIDLQSNFRSTPRILESVNAVFRRLMRSELGGIAYDRAAELHAGGTDAPEGEPVELHLLEKSIDGDADEDGEARYVDLADPRQWRGVEREAFLVGTRIRELLAGGMTVETKAGPRPLEWRDICVLMRSTRNTAEPMAEMLKQMGIPAWTDVGGDLFAAMEVRDVLALLAILDNFQQDIPLAAVLRSGILGQRCNEDELVALRAAEPRSSFHRAVRTFAARGKDETLRTKVSRFLSRVEHFRGLARRRPLADVLWAIYRETDYLAYVGGLPHGDRRRANLIGLHERARQFGQFRRQGLRRFLRFIETLEKEGDNLAAPPAVGDADNVVRIMSVHKSKGLEFPVVFAAETGRGFNLGDAAGRFVFDRKIGIGIKAIDRERMIEYPTGLHRLCTREVREASLAEEMRVWYVATTRARQKLILVGTGDLEDIERRRQAADSAHDRAPVLEILAARSPLAWFVSAMGRMPAAEVAWNSPITDRTHLAVTLHDGATIQAWRIAAAPADATAALHRAVARLQPLPENEPRADDPAPAERVLARLDYAYAHLGASSVRAARAASEVKLPYLAMTNAHEATPLIPPATSAPETTDQPGGARRGRIVHTALQFLRLECVSSVEAIETEVRRMVEENLFTEADATAIDIEALAWFFETELGRRVRVAAENYRREWMFLSAEPAGLLDPTAGAAEEDRVLIRGVVDGLLSTDAGLEVIDFKTDRVSAAAASARAATYADQMRLYASAAANVHRRPVAACHLVFLDCRQIVEMREELP